MADMQLFWKLPSFPPPPATTIFEIKENLRSLDF